MIFAPAGDGPAKVSRGEAEMLFRLKDATLGAANAADWPRLFVQGVANHLLAHRSFAPSADAEVTGEEGDWLQRLFEADGARDDLERALLAFLAEDGIRPF